MVRDGNLGRWSYHTVLLPVSQDKDWAAGRKKVIETEIKIETELEGDRVSNGSGDRDGDRQGKEREREEDRINRRTGSWEPIVFNKHTHTKGVLSRIYLKNSQIIKKLTYNPRQKLSNL